MSNTDIIAKLIAQAELTEQFLVEGRCGYEVEIMMDNQRAIMTAMIRLLRALETV